MMPRGPPGGRITPCLASSSPAPPTRSAAPPPGSALVRRPRPGGRAGRASYPPPGAGGARTGHITSAARPGAPANQVNGRGRMDAVIHKAGVSLDPPPAPPAEGHATTLAVNTLAPY